MSEAWLDRLNSRAEITEVVLRYVRAIDRCDEALLRSCFHADARHRHGTFDGASADFCGHAMAVCRAVEATHHQLGPVSIELVGETAFVETYFTSHHRFGAVPPPGGQPHEDRFMGGRYVDRFERRQGVWKIAERQGINEWLRYEPASDRGFWSGPAGQRGRRDRDDPVYRR
ncbi:nuclear transport factor 2 family protein [Phenylobacterium sp.]|uniref:nuclear transport factor 2 family protein n=1 Tax=Phenylobacterium sp. TaxID=1871053 RepID=UPI002ED8F871